MEDSQGYTEKFTNKDMVLSWALAFVSNVILDFNTSKMRNLSKNVCKRWLEISLPINFNGGNLINALSKCQKSSMVLQIFKKRILI